MVAIFTYGFDLAAQNFAEAGCPLETLSDYPTLITEAAQRDYLTEEQAGALIKWREDRGMESTSSLQRWHLMVEGMTEIRSKEVHVGVDADELKAHLAESANLEGLLPSDKVKGF